MPQVLGYNEQVGQALKKAHNLPAQNSGNTDTTKKKQNISVSNFSGTGKGKQFEYRGPFKVILDDVLPIVPENDDEDAGMIGHITIWDETDPFNYTPGPVVLIPGGKVIVDTQRNYVDGIYYHSFRCEHDTIADVFLYKKNDYEYDYIVVGYFNDTEGGKTFLQDKFYTRLATITPDGIEQVQFGDVVQPVSVSGGTTHDYQDLTTHVGVAGATIGLTDSNSKVKFMGDGTVDVIKIRSSATLEERQDWGERPDGIPGSTASVYKNAGWRGIYHTLNGDVMTEVSESATFEIDGHMVEMEYPLIVPTTTDDEIYIISQYVSGNRDDVTASIITKAQDWASERFNYGLSAFYNGDSIDEQYRNIDTDSIYILGMGQDIYSEISGGTNAVIGLTNTTSTVKFRGGTNITITSGSHGEIIINGSTSTPAGVSKIIAGTNIRVSPSSGIGEVTISGSTENNMVFPNYYELAQHGSSDSGLAVGTNHFATSHGWLRVSILGSSGSGGCIRLVVNNNEIPISDGRSTMTQFYLIQAASVFAVNNGTSASVLLKFDGTRQDDRECIGALLDNGVRGVYYRYSTGDTGSYYAWRNASGANVYTSTSTPGIGSSIASGQYFDYAGTVISYYNPSSS